MIFREDGKIRDIIRRLSACGELKRQDFFSADGRYFPGGGADTVPGGQSLFGGTFSAGRFICGDSLRSVISVRIIVITAASAGGIKRRKGTV